MGPRSKSSGCNPNCPTGFDPATPSVSVDLNIPFDARYGVTTDLAVIKSYCTDNVAVEGYQFTIGNVPGPLFEQGN
jgi:hypothetical protein